MLGAHLGQQDLKRKRRRQTLSLLAACILVVLQASVGSPASLAQGTRAPATTTHAKSSLMTQAKRQVSPPVRLPAIELVAHSAPTDSRLLSPIGRVEFNRAELNQFEVAEPLQLKLGLPKAGPTIGGWVEAGYTGSGF